eukprot:6177701-Pleurochrysis_carterae.AAC.1
MKASKAWSSRTENSTERRVMTPHAQWLKLQLLCVRRREKITREKGMARYVRRDSPLRARVMVRCVRRD